MVHPMSAHKISTIMATVKFRVFFEDHINFCTNAKLLCELQYIEVPCMVLSTHMRKNTFEMIWILYP
jgi:hypothetical protein